MRALAATSAFPKRIVEANVDDLCQCIAVLRSALYPNLIMSRPAIGDNRKRHQTLRKVGTPRAMLYFFASLKIAIAVAFVGSILAETGASDSGIGHLMLVASSQFQVALAFAGLMVTAAMGIIMYLIAILFECRMVAGRFVRTESKMARRAASVPA